MSFSVIECPGQQALLRLEELRAEFRSTGRYPFLIGDEGDLKTLRRFAGFENTSPSEIVAESLALDGAIWLKEREAQSRASGYDQAYLMSEWPKKIAENTGISLHKNTLSKTIKPIVYIGLAEIEEPWMLPSITGYGGWNECPEPAVHCAIMRSWYGAYGAEIVAMCHDIVECTVKAPPATREAAIELAWQQYWYCCDIVEQGTQSIHILAAGVMNCNYWFFWWD